jgi:hypothetical protein
MDIGGLVGASHGRIVGQSGLHGLGCGMPGRDKRTGVMGARNRDMDIGNPHPGVGQVGKELLVERRRGCQRRWGRQGFTSPGSAVGSADTGGDSAMAAAITSAASVAGRLMAR